MNSSNTLPYVRIEIGSLNIAMPQQHIVSVELYASVSKNSKSNLIIGYLKSHQSSWPVIQLCEQLQPITKNASLSRFVVCIKPKHSRQSFALCCDRATPFMHQQHHQQAMPPAMEQAFSPIKGIIQNEGNIYFMSDADLLMAYLNQQWRFSESLRDLTC